MTRIKSFTSALIWLAILFGLGLGLAAILEMGSHLQDDNQQIQTVATPEPTSTTLFSSPILEPGLGEIWFGNGEGFCRQSLGSDGRAFASPSCTSLELPPNSRVGRILWLSPDGSQVFYGINNAPRCVEGCGGSTTMYVLDVSTGQSRHIINVSESGPRFLGWHLDSQHLKFGDIAEEIGLINVNTGEHIIVGEEIYKWTDQPYPPLVDGLAFSPDGQWVVVSFTLTGQGGEVWMARADSSEARKLFEGYRVSGISWSPDGRHIAFVGRGVEVMDANGQNRHTVADTYAGGAIYPAWSPDSRYLLFQTIKEDEHLIQIVDVVEGTSTYLGQDLAGGVFGGPAWSPDGSQVVFASDWSREELGFSEIWVANRDGTGLSQLISGQTKLSHPIWVPALGRQH